MAKNDEGSAPTAEAPKEKVRVVPTKIEHRDDKRAQYARLVVFNFLKGNPKVAKKKAADFTSVNEVSNTDLLAGLKALTGGNYLDGPDGLKFIQEHSANGSTTGRALTTSYASEVRPFIRKGILSEAFGRRGGLTEEEKAKREEEREAAKAAKMQERIETAAKKDGIDLKSLKGTGDKGAVTLEDVRTAVKAKKDAAAAEAKQAKEAQEAKEAAEAAAATS